MTRPPPPLRFLLVVLGGWTAARALFLAPDWMAEPVAAAEGPGKREAAGRMVVAEPAQRPRSSRAKSRGADTAVSMLLKTPSLPRLVSLSAAPAPLVRPSTSLGTNEGFVLHGSLPAPAATHAPRAFAVERARPVRSDPWSFSAWTFLRPGEGDSLAPGGTLGGSQAGARLTYRLGSGFAVAARAYAPLRHRSGAEAALGLEWKPLKGVPVRLLAERRQALAGDGRNGFGLTAHGGVSEVFVGGFRIDAYGQAGIVGAASRDLFADGMVRAALPLGRRARVGAGAWAAAQPGVSRIDVGPHASLRLAVAGKTVTVAADWRLRVSGNARPGSGPSLTLATDF